MVAFPFKRVGDSDVSHVMECDQAPRIIFQWEPGNEEALFMVLYQLMEANFVEATPGSPATHRDPANTNILSSRQLGKSHPRENNPVTTRREARRGARWYLLWGNI